MSKLSQEDGASRLEVILTIALVASVGLFVYLFIPCRLPRAADGTVAGVNGSSKAADGTLAEGSDDRSLTTNESADFSAKSRVMVRPGAGSAAAATDAALTNLDATNDASQGDGRVTDLTQGSEQNGRPGGDSAATNAPSGENSSKAGPRPSYTIAGIEAELQRIANMPWGPEADKNLQDTLARWAAIDPVAALAYAMNLDSRRSGTAAVNSLLGQWAQRDPAAAYAWFRQQLATNPQMVSQAINSLFGKIAATDFNLALRDVADLPSEGMRNSAFRAVISQLLSSGQQDQVMQYFNMANDPNAQGMIAEMMVDQWSTYYPEIAAAWIASLTDPAVRSRATLRLIAKWGSDNPAKAAQWVAGLPRDQSWGAETARMVDLWVKIAPDKTAAWLMSLFPPSTQLDPGIQSLVNAVMKVNPEGAMAWATSMTDIRNRYSLMQRVGMVWLQQDPNRAAAYILSSELPNSIKRKLLKGR